MSTLEVESPIGLRSLSRERRTHSQKQAQERGWYLPECLSWAPFRSSPAPFVGSSMERPDNTLRFLRMTAAQLRRLAERVPEIADELRSMAQQLEAEADDLDSNSKP